MAWIASKALVLDDLRAALSCRGRIYATTDLAREIEAASPRSFPDLVACLPGVLSAAIGIEKIARPQYDDTDLATVVGLIGWCPIRGRCVGYLLSSSNDWVPAPYQPWSMTSVGRMVSPGVAGSDGIIDQSRDIRAAARSLLTAQREDPYAPPGGAWFRRVGGFGEVTTVTAAGVSVERVVTWPDQIGEPIAA